MRNQEPFCFACSKCCEPRRRRPKNKVILFQHRKTPYFPVNVIFQCLQEPMICVSTENVIYALICALQFSPLLSPYVLSRFRQRTTTFRKTALWPRRLQRPMPAPITKLMKSALPENRPTAEPLKQAPCSKAMLRPNSAERSPITAPASAQPLIPCLFPPEIRPPSSTERRAAATGKT